MILDESARSNIDDPSLVDEMLDVIYQGSDPRPAWIGGHLPETTVPALRAQADWAAAHYNFYLNFVGDWMERRGSVLDIGCGAGQNTAMLARYSTLAVGIDSDPKAIAFARKHNTNSGAVFEMGAFPDAESVTRAFDYAFIIETMEHIPYDEQFQFLDSALSQLGPDGRLFITTPDEQVAAPPHIGIWSDAWLSEVVRHLRDNIVRRGYFDNTNPSAGFVGYRSSHHALVLRP